LIDRVQQGLKEEGYRVSVSQLCLWFDVPRRTFYYRPSKSTPKLRAELVAPNAQIRRTDLKIYESVSRCYRRLKREEKWLGWLDLNQRMTESESVESPAHSG
jgi:hypothetical protein